MHHNAPLCDKSFWGKDLNRCRLCGVRGIILDMTLPVPTLILGRQAGVEAGHQTRVGAQGFFALLPPEPYRSEQDLVNLAEALQR